MDPIAVALAVWILVLALATMGGKGKQFALWTWGVVTHPAKVFWSHYGSYVLTLLIGAALGAYYAPAIRSLAGH